MKMEQIECFETSAHKIQTPGNYPEENIHLLLLLGNLFVHYQHRKNQLHYSVVSQFGCVLLEVNTCISHVSWLRLVTMPLRDR
jgi:hypothetical protein